MMREFLDIFMLTLFFLFMLFVFGGYHKMKYKKREEFEKNEQELK